MSGIVSAVILYFATTDNRGIILLDSAFFTFRYMMKICLRSTLFLDKDKASDKVICFKPDCPHFHIR